MATTAEDVVKALKKIDQLKAVKQVTIRGRQETLCALCEYPMDAAGSWTPTVSSVHHFSDCPFELLSKMEA